MTEILQAVGTVFGYLVALASFSVILVVINEKIISLVREPSYHYKRVVPLVTSLAFFATLPTAFPELFPFTIIQTLFFGVVLGFASEKLYDSKLLDNYLKKGKKILPGTNEV